MEQQDHIKPNVIDAICEFNTLCRNAMQSPSPSTSSSSASLSPSLTVGQNLRSALMVPQAQTSQTINSITDSFNTPIHNRSNAKIQISFHPRYISKMATTERRLHDSSHRMRPYYIPERSRTKSENNMERDVLTGIYPQTANNFSNAINSNSSSTSMMETCDGYVITESGISSNGQSSAATAYGFNNTFTGQTAIANNFNYNQTQQLTNNQSGRAKLLSLNQLKKSKSLEDIRVENLDGSQPSHEMEFVSSRIQKLKVQE